LHYETNVVDKWRCGCGTV